jgi:hypothetical protein
VTPCRRELHFLDDPPNVGVQRSTGRQFWRACKREYRRDRRRAARPEADLCGRGLHDLSDEANLYVRPGTGRRECRACKADGDRRRREGRAAQEAEAEAARAEAEATRRAAVRTAAAWPYGNEKHARGRLALMVRASKGA